MASYEIYIPASAFALGGPLENTDERKARVVLPLRTKYKNNLEVGSENTTNKVVLNDFDMQPFSTTEYASILNMIDKGIIEIYDVTGKIALTPTTFNTLYRTWYQQL